MRKSVILGSPAHFGAYPDYDVCSSVSVYLYDTVAGTQVVKLLPADWVA